MRVDWYRGYILLALLSFGNFVQVGSRMVLSPLVPDIIDAFSVSKATLGIALTGMWAAYALAQYPSGRFGDRFGEHRVVMASLVVLGISSLLLSLTENYLVFFGLLIFLGAGGGLFYTVAATLLAERHEKTGGPLGVLTAGGMASGLVFPVAAVYLAAIFHWRVSVTLGAVLAIPLTVVVFWKVQPAAPREQGASRDSISFRSVVSILRRPRVSFTVFLAFCTIYTFQSFSSFFPTFMIEYHGLSPKLASVAFGSVFFTATFMLPVFGRISDTVGRDVVLMTNFVVLGTGLGVLLMGRSLLAIGIGSLFLGLGFAWTGTLQARFMDVFSREERNSSFGFVRSLHMFIGSSGSAITGILADGFGWMASFGLIIGLVSVAAIAILGNRQLNIGW